MTPDEIALWQTLLVGVDVTVAVTGEWDRATGRATAEWQRSVGLVGTGTLNAATWAAAGDALAVVAADAPPDREPVALGDRGPAVQYAQRRLAARGFMVQIDGVFGPAMRWVVREFREAAGLGPGDLIDQSVWDALG